MSWNCSCAIIHLWCQIAPGLGQESLFEFAKMLCTRLSLLINAYLGLIKAEEVMRAKTSTSKILGQVK